MGEVFLCLGRCEFVAECGFAPVLWVGARGTTRGSFRFGCRIHPYGVQIYPTVRFVCHVISEQTPFGLDGQWRKPESHFLKAVP